ncbi:hypothetical protein EDB92DRAFT_2116166 [Lactarius akahatsu]|uniref:Sodium/calcium exchanger membrane region domain-containing protein n=1 Tax=Lactarius akahatsu TaxID=416441 RepID=A0AAD4LDK8_9AGAM|nr:hypothetical protein EDB92DRAFT_2116166 [Lactarius akahatsu]
MASQGSISDKEMLSLAHAVSNTPPLTSKGRFWQRFSGRDRRNVGWWESARAIFFVSWINSLLIFIPLAWASHYDDWGHRTTFSLCFLAIIPLEKLFDWGGEQMTMYLGKGLGDLVVVTLHNAVEATLAIILLLKCDLKLLQSTITGVVLLHLLLIPGTAFFTGGARVREQMLHPHRAQLNLTLLTVGVLALTILAAFFAATDINNNGSEIATALSDKVRGDFLRISRGFAVILLVIYVGSLFYLHDPPGANNAFMPHPDDPAEVRRMEYELKEAKPEVNPWACLILLAITVALTGVTAEFLVDSIEFVRERDNIEEEWFGIILLPIVSFSADATIAVTYFTHHLLKAFFRSSLKPQRPESLAQARSIDMSIQFLLFWMPFVTLLGWWTNKPMSMLFDLFEVVLLVGACFLVNYVTADAKTNWAEGSILIAFYAMIGLSAWYYTGQNEVRIVNACTSVATALLEGVEDSH